MGVADRDYLRSRASSLGDAGVEPTSAKPTFRFDWRSLVALVLALVLIAGAVLSAF